ncbi:AAA family ATPase [Methylocystis sp.]|uniref:AAA family ATPase n=1 Tax=Methylocystis sp. TaxID=1911079 RepID=UPI0025CC4D22|nr:AAA family ATPase [Methylocystis sp.]
MIRIEKIEIVEFRGIRNLTLSLDKKSFGIAGPNGTGKSGIVDAIEFALTGNITRLGGTGTAELSVKAHAPHVDSVSNPEKSIVRITAYAPLLGKSITIERTVKGIATPSVTPNDTKTQALLAQLETHPEFALSRREIIKYILTPAGDRSKDVQTLLRLDQIEKVRMSFQRVANDAKKESTKAATDDSRTKQDFFQYLGIKAPKKDDLLIAVNERRNLLKLEPLPDLTPQTLIKQDVVAEEGKVPAKQRLSKATTLSDLAIYHQYVVEAGDAALKKSKDEAFVTLTNLISNPAILKSFRQKVLVEQGLELIEDEACPLCDTAWDVNELKAHLQEKVANASAALTVLDELNKAIQPLTSNLENIVIAAKKIVQACGQAEPKIDSAAMSEFILACENDGAAIEKVCTDPGGIADAVEALKRTGAALSNAVTKVTDDLKQYVDALPDPSKEEAAKEFLIVAQEKYDRCRSTKEEAEAAFKRADLAAKVFEHYGKVSTSVLEAIYDTVQNDFTEYYSFINRDDEEKFEGKLTPSVGKLAFDVDFYGRGKFPPGAYHSEGHQDGMGLCLYLALMKHTLGDEFTLAVLDDVLMSVDAGHRREVCALLKTKFPKTQFVLTTHDPVWLQFMRTENLIQGSISFGGWTVDSGPQVWSEEDVWTQIASKLASSDVPGAAATLRRYLEYVSTILADNLRARVEYHGNGQYDLGDLWPTVIQTWKARLQEAKESAASWNKSVSEIEAKQAEAKQKIADTQSEQWMINKAVHYTAWANLQPKEFASVATAFQVFLKSMQCSNAPCSEFLCVSPAKGEREALRCGCGNTNLNLKMNK